MKELHQELLEDGLISESHNKQIDAIRSRKVISLYFELRLVLYLGIMLFSGGIGYLVYLNMSNIGHMAIMFLITLAIGVGVYYIDLRSNAYANGTVKKEIIYFDYLVVLVALLLISLFTYIQVYFDLVEILLKWTSLISALIFMFLAYRYDNKMVLSFGIAALGAVFGLTVSPINWASGDWLPGSELYFLSVGYGSILLGVSYWLAHKDIKKHFTFTYQHFGWLLFYFGVLALSFDHHRQVVIAFFAFVISVLILIYHWKHRSFLFFLYASLTGYILLTYLIFSSDLEWEGLLLLGFFYFPVIIGGFIIFLVKNKKHFSNED